MCRIDRVDLANQTLASRIIEGRQRYVNMRLRTSRRRVWGGESRQIDQTGWKKSQRKMSLLSIRADPCVTNQPASDFCSCQPLGVLLLTSPAIWRIRPYWPYDESPDGLSFLIPCGTKWVIGIPTHTGNTRGNNRGDHREIPSPLRNFS